RATIDVDGMISSETIEPMTHYSALMMSRESNGGRTNVDFGATAVHRDIETMALDFLHDRAYAAGVGFDHRFGADRWKVNARLLGSSVQGSTAAIARTQTSSQRYFQRPDADHVDFDPSRTRLEGVAALGSIARDGGE